MNGVVAWKEGT